MEEIKNHWELILLGLVPIGALTLLGGFHLLRAYHSKDVWIGAFGLLKGADLTLVKKVSGSQLIIAAIILNAIIWFLIPEIKNYLGEWGLVGINAALAAIGIAWRGVGDGKAAREWIKRCGVAIILILLILPAWSSPKTKDLTQNAKAKVGEIFAADKVASKYRYVRVIAPAESKGWSDEVKIQPYESFDVIGGANYQIRNHKGDIKLINTSEPYSEAWPGIKWQDLSPFCFQMAGEESAEITVRIWFE